MSGVHEDLKRSNKQLIISKECHTTENSQCGLKQDNPIMAQETCSSNASAESSSSCNNLKISQKSLKEQKPYQSANSFFKKAHRSRTLSTSEWLQKTHVVPGSSAERALLCGILYEENQKLKALWKSLQKDCSRFNHVQHAHKN